MKIAIPIEVAKHHRYHDALAAKSEIKQGQYLVSPSDYREILKAHPLPARSPLSDPAPARSKSRMRGAGDLFHLIALPVARLFRLSCIDPKTGRLRPASPCARRQAHWNTLSSRFFRSSIALLNRLLPFRAQPPRR